MKLRTTMTGLALTAGFALSLAPAGLATAVSAGPDRATPTVARHDAATTKAEQQHVEDYWTPARMKSAIPVGMKRDVVEKGKPTTGGSAVAEAPQPRHGKVFFSMSGSNWVCSGTATNSSNGDVVTTAGHCVNEGPGAFATNFAFVPAYNNGAAPYGTWTARELVTTTQWQTAGDFNFDVGFAVMNDNAAGQDLTQAVGGYGIAFNQVRNSTTTYKAYGYPAAQKFNGQTLWSCTGTVVQDTYGGSTDQGLACNMTGGSSGGGWIANGSLNSVTSFGYTGVKNILWGPYFGGVIQSTFNIAAGL
jgi:hypothetical protein